MLLFSFEIEIVTKISETYLMKGPAVARSIPKPEKLPSKSAAIASSISAPTGVQPMFE